MVAPTIRYLSGRWWHESPSRREYYSCFLPGYLVYCTVGASSTFWGIALWRCERLSSRLVNIRAYEVHTQQQQYRTMYVLVAACTISTAVDRRQTNELCCVHPIISVYQYRYVQAPVTGMVVQQYTQYYDAKSILR